MSDTLARNIFGAIAFLTTAAVIAAILSPYVDTQKEAIANVILGNALAWPGMVMAYYFGSSSGSKAKDIEIVRQMNGAHEQ
jgi:hypothetical protein